MSKPATQIEPSKALYIKLGRSGSWEKECLENGILRFGYKETPFDAAVLGDWKTVHEHWLVAREDPGAATRDVNQIRHYFEAGEDTLWITFYDGRLWWCFAKAGVKQHQDGKGSYRETVSGWHDTDINGGKLSFEKLSGNLLKVRAFQGTICDVREFEYLKRKLNGLLLSSCGESVAEGKPGKPFFANDLNPISPSATRRLCESRNETGTPSGRLYDRRRDARRAGGQGVCTHASACRCGRCTKEMIPSKNRSAAIATCEN